MFATQRFVFALAVCLTASASVAAAQGRPVLTRHLPDAVRSGEARPEGTPASSEHFALALSLPLRNEAELDALLADIYNPASPNFHRYLDVTEFTERFGATQSDYDAVVAWAQNNGLTVTALTPNRRVVDVEGSASVINHAFHINLQRYNDPRHAGRTFHAPDREPTVDLAVPLLAISGLENAQPKVTHLRKAPQAGDASGVVQQGAAESAAIAPRITGSGPNNTYLPSDMRAAYYGSGPLTGAGQTVAVFSYDGYKASDVSLYYSSTGTSTTVPINNVLVNNYNGACFGFNANGSINYNTCDDGEQVLDIVNVIGVAPGLTQVLFYEGNSATDILNRMVTDNVAKVISCSWGGGDFGSASTPIFKQMAAQGQTFLNATGDDGQFNSSTFYPPSLDPNITQVGGTNLNTTGAAGPWASETGWAYSGGGYRTTAQGGFAIPSWQQVAGVISSSNQASSSYRNAPDVAAEANFDNTTADNGTFSGGYGGTSYAAPRWAGFVALANQQAVANGKSTLGFLNPTIYNIGTGSSYTANFHDITSGNNKPTAGAGSGFNAVTGYDLVTGWGSPTNALITTLAGDFTLSASPSGLSVGTGSTGSSTIIVAASNGFAGAISLSASGLPSGVTASFSPSSTTSTSTLQLNVASSASAGSYPITVMGTAGTLSHSATVNLTITSVGLSWTKVAMEGDTVFLPKGTTYRFGSGSSFTSPVTTTADGTYYVYFTTFGDPAPGVVKELDVVGDGTGVTVNGVPFKTSWTKIAMEGDTVLVPRGSTYRFGTGTRFTTPQSVSADSTYYVYFTTFGDPAPGVVKELDIAGDGTGAVVNGVRFNSGWSRVAKEGDTVFLPKGTTYRFGVGTSFLSPVTTSADSTLYVYYTTFGGDPAPGVVKNLDVVGTGAGVIVNGSAYK